MIRFHRLLTRSSAAALATLGLCLGGPARADFVDPATASLPFPNWTRPETSSTGDSATALATNTTYQFWDVFRSTAGGNINPLTGLPVGQPNVPQAIANTPDWANPHGTPNAWDRHAPNLGQPGFNPPNPSSQSFLTSGGNIYSFSDVIQPAAAIPTEGIAGNLLNVMVQVKSLGMDILLLDNQTVDYYLPGATTPIGSVTFPAALSANGVSVRDLPNFTYTELYRGEDESGFGGAPVEHLWTFTIPDTGNLELQWAWGGVSSSWDMLSVDTISVPVPEPSTWLLTIIGSASVLIAARRGRISRAALRH